MGMGHQGKYDFDSRENLAVLLEKEREKKRRRGEKERRREGELLYFKVNSFFFLEIIGRYTV